MSTTPPGWYQDPYGRAQIRWWSGTEWTSQVATNGQQFEDPLVAPPTTTTTPAVVVPPVAVPSVVVPPAAQSRSGVGWGLVAVVAVAALVVGALLGYVGRGGGDDGGSASVSTDGGGDSDTGNTDTGDSDTGDGDGAAVSPADPLFKSLANLDSFEFTLSSTTVGPTAADTSVTETSGSRDAAAQTSYQKMTSTSTTEGETDVSSSESWRVGEVVCTFTPDSDPQYEAEKRNPFELDIAGTMPGIFDLVLVSENAQLVGTEQLAGVEVEHSTFTIDGLGQGSGQQVTANSGEMWVATDGDYIVKYTVQAGLRSGPEGTPDAELFELNLGFELTSINQPVSIVLPTACPPPSDDTLSS